MIKKVYRSKFDIENLSRLRTSIPNGIDSFDYKGVVVNKPWGYEYLAFENKHVAIWILHLEQNHATSMHCHPNKKTSLIVLSGEVVCSTLEGWMSLTHRQGLIIDEAVFHSTKAISQGGVFLMEVESPPNKKDLVRFKDEYGRESQVYEGAEKMSRNTVGYEYVDFHDMDFSKRCIKKIRECNLSVTYHSTRNIHTKLKRESGDIICLLQGRLHDYEGNILLSTGDAVMIQKIKSVSKIFSFGDVLYLSLSWRKK